MSECRNWYKGDPILEEYHDHEWCKVNHDDDFQFQMLCLEGASVGLSWQIIMHKRADYLAAFHGFICNDPCLCRRKGNKRNPAFGRSYLPGASFLQIASYAWP